MRKVWRIYISALAFILLLSLVSRYPGVEDFFHFSPGGCWLLLYLNFASALWCVVVYIFKKSDIRFFLLFDGHQDDTGLTDLDFAGQTQKAGPLTSSSTLLNWSLLGADYSASVLDANSVRDRQASDTTLATCLYITASLSVLSVITLCLVRILALLGLSFVQDLVILFAYASLAVVVYWPLHPTLLYARQLVFGAVKRSFALSPKTILPLGSDRKVQFIDVVICDVLTSFAQPLADAAIYLLHLVIEVETPTMDFAVATVVATIPYSLRLKQCLTEAFNVAVYASPNQRPRAVDSPALIRRRHFKNAAKYASAFPVIILSGLIASNYKSPSLNSIFNLWVTTSFINSLFSLVWDVKIDWLLGNGVKQGICTLFQKSAAGGSYEAMLSPSTSKKSTALPFLRKRLWFENFPAGYYLAIAFDVFARFSWIVKTGAIWQPLTGGAPLTPELFQSPSVSLKLLEIFRRMVWCIFRVEREWLLSKCSQAGDSDGGGLPQVQTKFPAYDGKQGVASIVVGSDVGGFSSPLSSSSNPSPQPLI